MIDFTKTIDLNLEKYAKEFIIPFGGSKIIKLIKQSVKDIWIIQEGDTHQTVIEIWDKTENKWVIQQENNPSVEHILATRMTLNEAKEIIVKHFLGKDKKQTLTRTSNNNVVRKVLKEYDKSPLFCEHANESPITCPCHDTCYCKDKTCKNKWKP